MKRNYVTLFLMVLILLFLGQTSFAQEYIIKHAYVSPELTVFENVDTAYISVFKGYVERASQGRIKVEIYPAGQLGNFRDLLEGAMMGNIQSVSIDSAGLSGLYPKINLLNMPGLFQSVEESVYLLNSQWGQNLVEDVTQKLNLKIVSMAPKGFRHFTNNIRELRTPEDAKGIKFRVMESPIFINMVEDLGAIAEPIPSAEMYSAIQQGVVDGQENPIVSIRQDLTFEVQKYMTLDGHTASFCFVLLDNNFFKNLPTDLQEIVLAGAERGTIVMRVMQMLQEEVGLKYLADYLEIYNPTPEEAAKWQEAVRPSGEAYLREQLGDDVVDEMFLELSNYNK